ITARPENLPALITHCLRLDDCRVISADTLQSLLRSKPDLASHGSHSFRHSQRQIGIVQPPSDAPLPFGGTSSASPITLAPVPLDSRSSSLRRTMFDSGYPLPLSNHSQPGALTPLVELRNVTVRYGSATILNRINWKIFPGESWALLGPNG